MSDWDKDSGQRDTVPNALAELAVWPAAAFPGEKRKSNPQPKSRCRPPTAVISDVDAVTIEFVVEGLAGQL